MAERAVLRNKGQLTLPTEIRRLAGLQEGDLLEFDVVEGRIVITTLKAIDPEDAWFWTEEWQAGERQASAELAAGLGQHYPDDESFFRALDAGFGS